MEYSALDQLCTALACSYQMNVPMASHTSFKIGGEADRLIWVPTKQALKGLLCLCQQQGIPVFILGKGSNLLVGDLGIRGAVLVLTGELKDIRRAEENRISCGAGVSLTALCNFARSQGLGGLEFAYGIPGTAGGAAYMNAGAYGGEMKDVLVSCTHMDPLGNEGCLEGQALELAYRKSAYMDSHFIITALTLQLYPKDEMEITTKMEALLEKRLDKQPIDIPSAGSTFKRPEGYFAAALIEECGLKGFCVGGAQVSEKHAGFVVNKGGASCKDVLALIQAVKEQVQQQKGVALECEVKLIGE